MLSLKNRYFLFAVSWSVLVFSACSKELNTNTKDPNGLSITNLQGKDLFAQALLTTVTNKVGSNISSSPGDNYDFAQEWMGYWSRNEGYAPSGLAEQIETFTISFSNVDGNWASLYHNAYDYSFIIGSSSKGSILAGASEVMRAMVLQDLTDQFGNIPFSQALTPLTVTNPAYDSASSIYKRLVEQVDSGIALIQASQSTADDASDIMFKGNKASWLAFANTLKLRLLLRQVPNVYQPTDPYIAGELASVVANGGFMGPGMDALIQPGFVDASLQQNPFWAVYGYVPGLNPAANQGGTYQNRVFFGANSIILDSLQAMKDPRISQFFYQVGYPASNGGYVGNALGAAINSASFFGPGILASPTAPALLFSASQSLFMQAEAAERGMMAGDANTLFKEGMEESFRYLGSSASADNFMSGSTDPSVNITLSANPLQTILTQKWIAECGLDGFEAWSDYRRTGLPAIFQGTGITLPNRLLYPETEFTQNANNVNAQGENTQQAQNIKMFWGN
jgi:hypothetical protein